MNVEAENLLKNSFPILEEQEIGYLSTMFEDLKDEYPELRSCFLDYLTAAFPLTKVSEHEDLFSRMCDLFCVKSRSELIEEESLTFDQTFRLIDKEIKYASMTQLSSDRVAKNPSIGDKARLEFEKRKMAEKQARKTNVEKKTTDLEFVASQQIDKQKLKKKSADIVLEMINLCFGCRVLLSNAHVTLSSGRIYGLIGRNGYGKTTFLTAISSRSLYIPPNISVYQVDQEVAGDDRTVLDTVLSSDILSRNLKTEISDLESRLNDPSLSQDDRSAINDLILEVKYYASRNTMILIIYAWRTRSPSIIVLNRAASILHGLGFSSNAQKIEVRKFSGGWRMRVSLAQALFMKPDLLLLDEPTNMLDLRSLYWLKNSLPKFGNTIIIVSHDRNFLDAVCTDIIHLTDQQLFVYKGNYSVRDDNLLRQKRQYESQTAHKEHVQKFIDRFSCGTRAASVQSRIKQLNKIEQIKCPEEEPRVVLRFEEIEEVKKNLVQLDDVSFGYQDGQEILSNATLCISPKSRIAIIGDNGSGKSTLLKIIIGTLSVTSGQYLPYQKLKCGYLAQHHLDQLPVSKCALEILASQFPGKSELEYRKHLGSFGLSQDLAIRTVSTLSGGQKTRACLALIAMSRPNLLVFDEPTNHLDIETVDALIVALKAFMGAVVVVSHNEYFIKSLCTDFYEVKKKRLKFLQGGFEQYLASITQHLALNYS
ncbi:ATP-binding cassette sub-family F member 3 [Thelohanellus kitauei]|uniref:ATP-binding cassette sub-family F member 3 n=1 Tax=Thelohanellus kitauei TaxID=669202 RepID=A0A0C2IX37_THEKT|nr:ATP-binding cassette sub-family F member 3 [Thelohanellus kitauei]